MGIIQAICISEVRGVQKHAIPEADLTPEWGIVGDAHGGNWHRQVSLLASESVDKIRHHDVEGLCNGRFAENLTTTGLLLWELPVGTRLRIGETVQEVNQIGKECHDGCAIQKLVGQCVMPREGIFTRVIRGGTVREGDSIEVMAPLEAADPTRGDV